MRDRAALARGLRQSIGTATSETAVLIRRGIRLLEDPNERLVTDIGPNDVSDGIFSLEDEGGDEDTSLPPNFVTYMAFGANPEGRGHVMYGVTSIQTDNEFAKIYHTIRYNIGGNAYSRSENSGGWATFWSTQIAVDCPAQITVSGNTDSRLEWMRTRPESTGHGSLPATNCGPRPTAEEDVVEPAGGSCEGTSCNDYYPTAEYCVVRYRYYLDTGQIIGEPQVLYCY